MAQAEAEVLRSLDRDVRRRRGCSDGRTERLGYQTAKRDAENKLHATIAQMLLVNRSPRLEDLSTEVLTALRDHPAIGPWERSPLYGTHRAVAALGHADAPPPAAGGQPHETEGAARNGWPGSTSGRRPRPSPRASERTTTANWPRLDDGRPRNTPRSPGRPTGPGRRAPPGSTDADR